MKIILYIFIGIIIIIGIYFIALSISSRKQPELGLLNGQLRVCPAMPNCVCSEQASSEIAPLSYITQADVAWDRVKQIIVTTGGKIISEQRGYLHAQYESPLMRYIDDVELRLDASQQRIHIRSASRVGYSDLGANQKRLMQIRSVFNSDKLL
ncbi:hypothetical protein MNBD_GAMMA25-1247 [hydrothermal vent metagenome]|uniref:DUF1499 domain-containing protein n=1 Tax=hydrothermal vent metagenome TaxID=652676 RepID=A0A3B1AUQ6_9ZZZZ